MDEPAFLGMWMKTRGLAGRLGPAPGFRHEAPTLKALAPAEALPVLLEAGSRKGDAEFCDLVDKLCNVKEAGTWNGDRYLVIYDFPSFIDAQNRVE